MRFRTVALVRNPPPNEGMTVSGWLPAMRGVEGRVEPACRLQREEAVGARAEEVVLKGAARIDLVEIDAAPQPAAERADVPRLARKAPRQLARRRRR